VLSANPVGLVVSAIAALVAAFTYLWNNSEEFRQFWLDMWDEIQKVASAVVEAVAEFFIGLWDDIKAAWSAVTGFFTGIWDEIKKSASNLVESVANFFSGMWDGLKNGAKAAWEGIKSVFGSIADWFKDKFSKAWQAVKDVFSTGGKIFDGIKDGIVSAFKMVVNAIIRGINKVIALPFDGINAVLEKIKNVSILGYQPFDWIGQLPVPQIPELKRGGILKRGQVGLLEGNGAEAVVPLENNKKWIHSTASDLRRSLAQEGIIGGTGSSNAVTNTYNFNQVNNSPKALSRLEIYRQSKNLLALQGV
jgi:phage-related protein